MACAPGATLSKGPQRSKAYCLFCFLIACAACRSGEYVRVGALSPESTEEELTRDYTWRHISPHAKQQPLVRASSLSSCVLRTRR